MFSLTDSISHSHFSVLISEGAAPFFHCFNHMSWTSRYKIWLREAERQATQAERWAVADANHEEALKLADK
jgi:hypothetical protein